MSLVASRLTGYGDTGHKALCPASRSALTRLAGWKRVIERIPIIDADIIRYECLCVASHLRSSTPCALACMHLARAIRPNRSALIENHLRGPVRADLDSPSRNLVGRGDCIQGDGLTLHPRNADCDSFASV